MEEDRETDKSNTRSVGAWGFSAGAVACSGSPCDRGFYGNTGKGPLHFIWNAKRHIHSHERAHLCVLLGRGESINRRAMHAMPCRIHNLDRRSYRPTPT